MIATIAAVLMLGTAQAAPVELTHQGRLLDTQGDPIEGSTTFSVGLYASETGGSAAFSETFTEVLADGYFSVQLTTNDSDDAALDSALFNTPTYVSVTTFSELLPRTKVTSVPMAAHATTAGHLALGPGTGACADGAVNVDVSTSTLRVCANNAWVAVGTSPQRSVVYNAGLGVSLASGAWRPWPYTSVGLNDASVSLTNNVITVPAGRYLMTGGTRVYAGTNGIMKAQFRLYNVTADEDISDQLATFVSYPISAAYGGAPGWTDFLPTEIDVSVATQLRIDVYPEGGTVDPGTGQGPPSGSGQSDTTRGYLMFERLD